MPLTLKRRNTRLLAGANVIPLDAVTKTENVGVPPCAIDVVTDAAGVARQAAVLGFVWQSVIVTGRDALPVSAVTTTMAPVFPALSEATANAPNPANGNRQDSII
jgi:hypothetical protein